MKAIFPTVLVSLLALAGCSKSDTTDTPTPIPTATATATITPSATPLMSPSATAMPAGSPFANMDVRLRDLETKMDAIFADTFRGVGNWFDQSTHATSVDLREQNDKYVARLYVPKGDKSKVDAKVENGVLHITAQAEGTANGKTETERHEEFITLAKPVQTNKVDVQQKQDVVVITVLKSSASAPAVAAASPAPAATASPSESPADWADTMLAQMNQMQAKLDQSVRDVFQNDSASSSQLGSAMNIDDQAEKYVVHFYLPDKNLSDVNVKFENNQLHLTAQEQKKSDAAAGDMQGMTVARYETMTTLPGPVKDADMKVERKKGSVVVTLPKA